jgi:quinoprotein glucose dehydrogenase
MHLKTLYVSFLIVTGFSCRQPKEYAAWEIYRGGNESNCYSSLTQIDTSNVNRLKVAWTYHTGDSGTTMQCNPIVVNNRMYITSPSLNVIALDAATGKLIWKFIPPDKGRKDGVNRGVTYWDNKDEQRILLATGYTLYAIAATTGKLINSFGYNGTVDLRKGLDRHPDSIYVEITSPGIVYKDLLIIGSRMSEGEGAAPGHIRAFNIITGKQAWTFHTIPQPGEYGYETWEEDAWKKIGGANAWAGFSLDEKRSTVFAATGSAAPDFYGGDRKGQNLFANSVIALDATTGKRKWHYQIVHHDLWDYDLPTPPNLVTVTVNGNKTDAVVQATKTGQLFILNRETGEPIFGVEERKVPVTDIEGEESWPTQPFPLKPAPFVRQRYTMEDISDISPAAEQLIKEKLKQVRNEGIFTPSSARGTLIFPGFRGGAEWNGGAFDPETGVYYINANEIPNISTLKKQEPKAGQSPGEIVYKQHCATCHGIDRKGQPPAFPSLISIDKKLSAAAVSSRMRLGKGQMPAFPNLSQQQVSHIVAYLFGKEKSSSSKVSNGSVADSVTAKTSYAHSGYGQFLDEEGYPAVKPPWGTLNAIDLNSGLLLWKIPLGEYAELTKRGVPVTGTQNFGGAIVTAGGLIFVGATKDEKFRAIHKGNGRILWETLLPAGGYATPSTYHVNGKQYVVIAAGGGGRNNTKTGDAYVAFALP